MCKMLMKNYETTGSRVISIDAMLQAEPLALYFNRATGELKLSLADGGDIRIGRIESALDFSWLSALSEITIQSECGGLLAGGYRVGVRGH